MVVGTGLQIAALGLAPVSIVQPVIAGGLVVALGARSLQERRAPRAAEVVGAGLTVLGLVVFLVSARPRNRRRGPPLPPWASAWS